MTALRKTLIAVAALLSAAGAALVYVIATFDPKTVEPQLVSLVRANTGRTLTIKGDLKLSFWPTLGVVTGPLELSERESSDVFARVASLRLSIELMPLLSHRFVANEIDLRGADVRIVRDADGRLNIDDLIGREGPPSQFDIGRLSVADSRVTFRDVASGATYEFTRVSARTARLTDKVPTTVNVTCTARNESGSVQFNVAFESGLTLDQAAQTNTFANTHVIATGRQARKASKSA